jgi:hypothetical protein
MSNNASSQNVSKQLAEVTDLIHTYQQKIAVLNEELDIVRHQLITKDKELDQFKIQLKNLKRSRSSEGGGQYARRQLAEQSDREHNQQQQQNHNDSGLDKIASLIINSTSGKYSAHDDTAEGEAQRAKRAMSVDSSADNSKKQWEMAKDEIKLLRNKIQRLEDDLSIVTQVSEADLLCHINLNSFSSFFFTSF